MNEAMKPLISEGLVIPRSRSMRIVRGPGTTPASHALAPQMVLIGGYAGSGKTEFGRVLAKASGWPILDKDTMTRPVVESALEVLEQPSYDRESTTYMGTVRPREYEAVMATAYENLACGVSVILTAPFLTEFRNFAWIERVRAACETHGAAPAFLWMRCDPESMLTYLRRRGAARDTGKLSRWDDYVSTLDVDFKPDFLHSIVDNSIDSAPLQTQATSLLSYLREKAR